MFDCTICRFWLTYFSPQLLFKAETLYFTPGSVICDKREPADRLMIVSNGSIDLYVYACDLTYRADVCVPAHFTHVSLSKFQLTKIILPR